MAINIKSGTVAGDYENTAKWNLHEEPTDKFKYRHFTFTVTFDTPFLITPTVVVALSGLDCGSPTANPSIRNTRVAVSAEKVTNSGFELKVTTWYDTLLYGVQVSWIAYAL